MEWTWTMGLPGLIPVGDITDLWSKAVTTDALVWGVGMELTGGTGKMGLTNPHWGIKSLTKGLTMDPLPWIIHFL